MRVAAIAAPAAKEKDIQEKLAEFREEAEDRMLGGEIEKDKE